LKVSLKLPTVFRENIKEGKDGLFVYLYGMKSFPSSSLAMTMR